MARSLGSSYLKASDIEYDFTCTPCEEKNVNSEALFYCGKCFKQYCKSCEKLHGQLLSTHSVLDRDCVKQWGVVKREVSMETCEKHGNKEVEIFCQDHDAICCSICVSLEHRSCKTLKHLPDVAKGIQNNDDFKKLLSDVKKIQSKLAELTDGRKQDRRTVECSCKNITSTVQMIREKLCKLLDDIEKKTLAEMERVVAEMNAEIKSELDSCKQTMEDITRVLDDMLVKGKNNDEFAFVSYKKGKKLLSNAENIVQSVSKQSYRIAFKEDKQIGKFISSLQLFGEFETSRSIQKSVPSADHVYKVQSSERFNVKIQGDTDTPSITGVCQLPNKHFVLVDCKNEKVKQFNKEFKSTEHLKMQPYPQDLCQIADYTVAVTENDILSSHKIHLIDASNGKLVTLKSIKLDHNCIGIAHHNRHLYIGTYQSLNLHSMDGALVKTLYNDPATNAVFRIAIGQDDKMYVSNYVNNCLTIHDKQGTLLHTFNDKDLKGPFGVCVGDSGSVFVCCRDSNTVMQVDKHGAKKLGTLASQDQGLTAPTSIYYNGTASEIIVGQKNDAFVVVLKIN